MYSKYVALSHGKTAVTIPKTKTEMSEMRDNIAKTEQDLSDFKYVEPLA